MRKNPYSFEYRAYKQQQLKKARQEIIFNNLCPILEMDIRNASAAVNGVTSV